MTTIDREKQDLAKRFVEIFYRTFDANRADLANLYEEDSMLLLDGQEIRGKEAILAKLTSLSFQQSQHHIATIEALASDRDMKVVVIGDIRLDGEQDASVFTQIFLLIPTLQGQGSFRVIYDSFRMNFWTHKPLKPLSIVGI